MSASKRTSPATPYKTPAKRARTPALQSCTEEESDRLIAARLQSPLILSSEENQKNQNPPPHPKGHKVQPLTKVWSTMDGQTFLHLTDTVLLGDVWVQPTLVDETSGSYTNVTFLQVVFGYHIKRRNATCKMAVEDVLRMLFCCDRLLYGIKKIPKPFCYDEWLAHKTAAFVKAKGVANQSNRSMLANYIILDDPEFDFYPECVKGFGLFCRKICIHSYKTEGKVKNKLANPAILKCRATRGKFEFGLEVALKQLPPNWREYDEEAEKEVEAEEEEELPDTQPDLL